MAYRSDYVNWDNCPDDDDYPDPRRCPHCNAFVSVHPTESLVVHGPDIIRSVGVWCKRCRQDAWSYDEVVGSVWPRFDWGYDVEPMEEYPSFEPPVEWVEAGEFIPADDLPF